MLKKTSIALMIDQRVSKELNVIFLKKSLYYNIPAQFVKKYKLKIITLRDLKIVTLKLVLKIQ